jgi:pyridoxal biosynthesis lyase PdxS
MDVAEQAKIAEVAGAVVQSWLWSAFPADIRYDGVAVIQQ